MTDTTDTAALPKMTLDELLIRCTDYDDGSLSMDAGELKMLNQHISLLEAERQRAEALQGQLDYRNEVLTRAIRQREAAEAGLSAMEGIALALRDEVRGLKGDQVPVITCYSCRKVMTRDQHAEADGFCPHCDVEIELDENELFTAPQKPVVLPQRYSLDDCVCANDNGEWMDSDDVIAAIEAAGVVTSDHSGDGDDKVGE